ncbi:MAG: 3-phosphoshikimate 1-carboxyvinyltransferase [Ruminococcaceae bacterium]|nr:3-phosphoshikimate 1-carboxyvinyltransferase [Oscillospiraceae bacterium]
MNVTLSAPKLSGRIAAIPSKSHAHRLLICAALADKPTRICCPGTNNDIDATARCLNALGVKITYDGCWFDVTPIDRTPNEEIATLDCGESGSTLRFMVPVVLALGKSAEFVMSGRLPTRPMSPLREVLLEHGACFSPVGSNPLVVTGELSGDRFALDGGVSSQFTTGLLLALPLLDCESVVELSGKVESRPYIDLTLASMKEFGVPVENGGHTFRVQPATYSSPAEIKVEGDWSNGAFMLCAGALSDDGVTVTGLNPESTQGDKQVLSILREFGAEVVVCDNEITVKKNQLRGITIDAADIPDLVPILSVVASLAEGKTVITGCARLRLKESDRLLTVRDMLAATGAEVEILGDSLEIIGKPRLRGGVVDSHNDHRIAMSAAVLASACTEPVTIMDAGAVSKSYPTFFEDLQKITN